MGQYVSVEDKELTSSWQGLLFALTLFLLGEGEAERGGGSAGGEREGEGGDGR